MDERIRNCQLRKRITCSEEAALSIKNGMLVAVGGYTPSGYPKVIPNELVRRRKELVEELKINLISGAGVGPEIDDEMGNAGLINRRIGLQSSRTLTKLINQGIVKYIEVPLSRMPKYVQNGLLGEIDIAIIEAIAITKEGYIIPSTSVGMVPNFIRAAKTIIVEINRAQPSELEGIHDIYLPSLSPINKQIPLSRVNQRIGDPFIRVDPDKIKYIVESNIPDSTTHFAENDEITEKISDNLLNFLELELKNKHIPRLLPIQSGLGNLANGVIRSFKNSNFNDIEFYCGVLQEANIELIKQGKVCAASGGSLTSSPKALELIRQNPDIMKKIMVLRPTDLSNNAEVISKLDLISLNNAIEIDIYGNANTSHIMGSKVVNGIGGGGVFSQNSYLSIMLLPSQTKGGDISTIVPMASHYDINEHDIDIIITENGVADLRGKDPIERANCIINNCASTIYKEQLNHYFKKCIKNAGGHQPQLLNEAFSWHQRLKETGTMKGER